MYALVIGEEVRWGSSLVKLVTSAAVIIDGAFKYIITICGGLKLGPGFAWVMLYVIGDQNWSNLN